MIPAVTALSMLTRDRDVPTIVLIVVGIVVLILAIDVIYTHITKGNDRK